MPCSGCSALHGVNPNFLNTKNDSEIQVEVDLRTLGPLRTMGFFCVRNLGISDSNIPWLQRSWLSRLACKLALSKLLLDEVT